MKINISSINESAAIAFIGMLFGIFATFKDGFLWAAICFIGCIFLIHTIICKFCENKATKKEQINT